MNGSSKILIQSLISEIRKGIALIEHLNDEHFNARPGNKGSIGTHFRHNLDFISNMLRGIETGRLDYSSRERDLQVETDREYAIERFADLVVSLSGLGDGVAERKLAVRSEVDEDLWAESSVLREVEFVHSHTVHHYALISAKLGTLGIELSEDFGVAPSTLKYWKAGKKGSATA